MQNHPHYYPLSPSQKILMLAQTFTIEPKEVKESNVLNIYFYIRENCSLDAMEASLNYVLQLHDSLRLRFVRRGLRTMQYIAPYEYFTPEREQVADEAAFREYLQHLRDIPVAMYNGNMVNARILRVGESGGAMVIRFFHCCTDGYSHSLIYPELEYAYDEYAAGRTPEMPEQLYSIEDAFRENERYRKSEKHKEDLKFWYQMFRSQRNYSLPVGRRALHGTCGLETAHITGDTYHKLYAAAKGNKSSMQSAVMLLDAVTFWALTGKDNFCFYTLYHGRNTPEMRKTVGCLMNTVPLFFDLDGSVPFVQAIAQTHTNYKQALSHGLLPMNDYLSAGYKESMRNGFNFNHGWILVSLAKAGAAARKRKYEFAEVKTKTRPYQFYQTMYDIEGEELTLMLDYQLARFTREQALKILNLLCSLIKLAADDPNITLQELKDAGHKLAGNL